MLLDKNAIFSDAQALAAGSANSSNVIDCGIADANLGAGTAVWLVVKVNTAFNTLDSIAAALQHSDTNGSFADVVAGPAVALADQASGTILLMVSLPAKHKRYLVVNYTIVGSNPTVGAVDAFLTLVPQTQ